MPSEEEELGSLIGKNIKDTDDLNQSMSHTSGEDTNIVFPINVLTNLEEKNIVARTRLIGDAFILGHSVNGILGTSKLGVGSRGNWIEIGRRLWTWEDNGELKKGTVDANINISEGDIRLG